MESRKPNLFIVGAPRCGTTSMYNYLGDHPDVIMSSFKETHYFGSDLLIKRQSYNQYMANFSGWTNEKYAGEASPMYLFSRNAAAEIKEYNPEARIIALFRNPVDFLNSYYRHIFNLGFEDIPDLAGALAAEADRQKGLRIPKRAKRLHHEQFLQYRNVAAFPEQLQRYFDEFGREQVRVIILDDLISDAATVYRETLEFLGIDTEHEPDFSANNAQLKIRYLSLLPLMVLGDRLTSGRSLPSRAFRKLIMEPLVKWNVEEEDKRPVPADLRESLTSEFAADVQKLGEMIDRDLSHWSRPRSEEKYMPEDAAATEDCSSPA